MAPKVIVDLSPTHSLNFCDVGLRLNLPGFTPMEINSVKVSPNEKGNSLLPDRITGSSC